MANDRDVKIRINTEGDPSGAEEVKDALENVTDAAADAADAINPMSMPDLGPERVEETAEALDDVTSSASKAGEELADLRGETEKLARAEKERNEQEQQAAEERRKREREEGQAADVRRIKHLQVAQVAGQLGRALGEASRGMREFSEVARGVDPDLAGKIDSVATGLDGVSAAAQGAAAGMVFGPFGAIIGGTAAGGFSLLGKEVDGLMQSLTRLAEAKAVSAEMPARIEAVRKALDMKAAAESWRELEAAINAASRAADAAQKIAAARDQAEVYKREQAARVARETGEDVPGADQQLREARDAAAINEIQRRVERARQAEIEAGQMVGGKAGEFLVAKRSGDTQAAARIEEELNQLRDSLKQARESWELEMEMARIEFEKMGSMFEADRAVDSHRSQQGTAAAMQEAERRAGDEMAAILDKILQALGGAADQPQVQQRAEAIRKIISDGLQRGEEDAVETALRQLAGELSAADTQRFVLMQEIINTLGITRDKLKEQQDQIDEQKRAIQRIQARPGRLNHY